MFGLRKLSAVGLVVVAMAWSGAAAAQSVWSDDFKALCGANPSDFDKAIRMAAARGYEEVDRTPPPVFARFAKHDHDRAWTLLVQPAFTGEIGGAAEMGLISRTCGVSGEGLEAGGIAEVKAWLGIKPVAVEEQVTEYVFATSGGRRISLSDLSDADQDKALKATGYWYAGISTEGPRTTVTLTHIKPAP